MEGSVGVALGGTLLGSDQLGCVVLGFVVLVTVLLGVVELGVVSLDDEVVLVSVEDAFVDDSGISLSDGIGSEEESTGASEAIGGKLGSLDSTTGCSSTGISASEIGATLSSTGNSLLSGMASVISIVPVSTIKEVSVVSSPAFNAPLRKPASPPRKTRMPHAPTMIFFMTLVLS